jgi:hypothetical protein
MNRHRLLAYGLSLLALGVLALLPQRGHAAAPPGPARAPLTPAPFTDVTTQTVSALPQVGESTTAWGDYDNDGRLDFLLTGYDDTNPVSKLYRNTGSTFSDASAVVQGGLPQAGNSRVAWGDYDNDGRLDFLLTGFSASGIVSKLYHNTGTGFADASGIVQGGLAPAFSGSAAWGDYDNDGRLDFLLTGTSSGNSFVGKLYHNTGTGFADASGIVQGGLPAVGLSAVAWGDYDADGRLDFLLAGYPGGVGGVSLLYHNTDNGFVDASGIVQGGLPQVYRGSVTWGDYDNDGRLDFLLTGTTGNKVSRLYHNTGSGFVDASGMVQGGLPQVDSSSVGWGDYDNDGQLDFLFAGQTASGAVSKLYHNTGTGFADATPVGLPQVESGSLAWGDYDNDGRLDFLLTGQGNTGDVSKLYHNDGSGASTPPGAPSNLQVVGLFTNTATLTWDPASGPQTSASGLSYNLRVGSSPRASDIVGPMANTTVLTLPNGLRWLPALGPMRPLTISWTVTGLAPHTTYYWSVQAIDPALAGGPFAAEESFTTLPFLTATPYPTYTPAPSATPYPTYTPGPSPTPYPTYTPGPSATPYPTYTAYPTHTPGPTSTPYPNDTPGPSATPYPTYTAGPSSTPYPTYTLPPTQTPGGPTATRPPSATPTATGTICALSFSDVQPTDYFYRPVQYLACHGVISGYADNTFRPYANTTRAQMVKIVVLGFGLPIVTPPPGQYTFADVPLTFPFFSYIETAAATGIVSGYTCGGPDEPCDGQVRPYFRPAANVTRGQLSKIVVGAAGWALLSPSGPTFGDVAPGSAFYSFVETAVCHGVISGYADQTFRPGANATRGQIAKIVYLALTAPPGACPAARPAR